MLNGATKDDLPAAAGRLSVLILENSDADYELLTHELQRFGFIAQCSRAETESEYLAQLSKQPDIILADYMLTGFNALRALELLQQTSMVIPFIVVTGAVREEAMVECMRRGASDYLLKDRVMRLGPAIQRASEESELRRQKLAAERALRQKNLELEAQYAEVQAASRMKSVFLANMSHELRTPLTAIIGFTELLVDGKAGELGLEHLDLLQEVLGNGRHLLGLINDVLDLAKVESGTMRFRPEPVSIPDVAGEAVTGLRLMAQERRVALISDFRVSTDHVQLDPQRFKQVLFNYISNALKFTPPGGTITVRVTSETDSSMRVEVEDTGIGISQKDLPRLFQDFQQIDDGLSKKTPGTGLGLALTRRLVEAQGGRVGVRSVEGEGSTFFAVIPYSLEQPVPVAAEIFSSAKPN
jgi:signal transduction histidine kinase